VILSEAGERSSYVPNGANYLLFTLYPKGKDATEAFEDVGHSDEARALLPGMMIGEFETGPNVNTPFFICSQPCSPHPRRL
jgi:cytochrome b involved in lipid metabolism